MLSKIYLWSSCEVVACAADVLACYMPVHFIWCDRIRLVPKSNSQSSLNRLSEGKAFCKQLSVEHNPHWLQLLDILLQVSSPRESVSTDYGCQLQVMKIWKLRRGNLEWVVFWEGSDHLMATRNSPLPSPMLTSDLPLGFKEYLKKSLQAKVHLQTSSSGTAFQNCSGKQFILGSLILNWGSFLVSVNNA